MTTPAPADVFHPGEFLADELEARDWTQSKFAEIIQHPTQTVNEIIEGKKAISPETARAFATAFGTSAHYWINLQTAYDLGASRSVSRSAQSGHGGSRSKTLPKGDLDHD